VRDVTLYYLALAARAVLASIFIAIAQGWLPHCPGNGAVIADVIGEQSGTPWKTLLASPLSEHKQFHICKVVAVVAA